MTRLHKIILSLILFTTLPAATMANEKFSEEAHDKSIATDIISLDNAPELIKQHLNHIQQITTFYESNDLGELKNFIHKYLPDDVLSSWKIDLIYDDNSLSRLQITARRNPQDEISVYMSFSSQGKISQYRGPLVGKAETLVVIQFDENGYPTLYTEYISLTEIERQFKFTHSR